MGVTDYVLEVTIPKWNIEKDISYCNYALQFSAQSRTPLQNTSQQVE